MLSSVAREALTNFQRTGFAKGVKRRRQVEVSSNAHVLRRIYLVGPASINVENFVS